MSESAAPTADASSPSGLECSLDSDVPGGARALVQSQHSQSAAALLAGNRQSDPAHEGNLAVASVADEDGNPSVVLANGAEQCAEPAVDEVSEATVETAEELEQQPASAEEDAATSEAGEPVLMLGVGVSAQLGVGFEGSAGFVLDRDLNLDFYASAGGRMGPEISAGIGGEAVLTEAPDGQATLHGVSTPVAGLGGDVIFSKEIESTPGGANFSADEVTGARLSVAKSVGLGYHMVDSQTWTTLEPAEADSNAP